MDLPFLKIPKHMLTPQKPQKTKPNNKRWQAVSANKGYNNEKHRRPLKLSYLILARGSEPLKKHIVTRLLPSTSGPATCLNVIAPASKATPLQ